LGLNLEFPARDVKIGGGDTTMGVIALRDVGLVVNKARKALDWPLVSLSGDVAGEERRFLRSIAMVCCWFLL
jgi:hypothetical protein